MDNGFELLLEKEDYWVRMLEEVLKDNGIPCVSFPVHGVAFSMKVPRQRLFRLYVPAGYLSRAEELRSELFSAEFPEDGWADWQEEDFAGLEDGAEPGT